MYQIILSFRDHIGSPSDQSVPDPVFSTDPSRQKRKTNFPPSRSWVQRRRWYPTPVLQTLQTRLSDFTFTFHFHALEKEMATHSSVLAWRIPGMGEPGGLLSMGSHRVGHNWSDLAAAAAAAGAGSPSVPQGFGGELLVSRRTFPLYPS